MAFLIDTSVLARLANTADAFHAVATASVVKLHRTGELIHLTAQNLVEFRSVATRPLANNGLGLSTAEAEAKAIVFEAVFPLLPETAAIYPAWKALVATLGIAGKQVHDARLVAVCHVHQITHMLTFNVSHFTRMAGAPPGLIVVDPASV